MKCSSLKSRYQLGKLRVLSGAEVCRILCTLLHRLTGGGSRHCERPEREQVTCMFLATLLAFPLSA